MEKEHSSRTQAIRKNVSYLNQHVREYIQSCENICDALDTLEDAILLKKVFLQITHSLKQLSEDFQIHHDGILGELEELVVITKMDNCVSSHLRQIEELIVNIQKIFSTSRLWQAVGFALIEQEISRLRKSRKQSLEIYFTIKAHYADQESKITDFLESTSDQKNWKMLHQMPLHKQIWH